MEAGGYLPLVSRAVLSFIPSSLLVCFPFRSSILNHFGWQAGVFASCAAGNEGPPPAKFQTSSKIGNPGPYYLSVGARLVL